MSAPSPSNTIIRIKRKATEARLEQLVIQDPSSSSSHKRRKGLPARSRGVFRLAETVPDTWKGEGVEGDALRSRIATLRAAASPTSTSSPASPSSLARPTLPTSDAPLVPASSDEPLESVSPPVPPVPLPPPPLSRLPLRGSSLGKVPKVEYRVVPPPSTKQHPLLPPKVLSAVEYEKQKSHSLVFVDAHAVSAPNVPSRREPTEPEDAEDEKDMAAFLPMLQEYLRMEPKEPKTAPKEQDEYVYDLYYRDTGPAAIQLGAGDGITPQSIGALLGYEDLSPSSSDAESELEDEADEDSNDEDYYRNDYPEDEDADEDMVGFHDGQSDGEWSEDERGESDPGERGQWDYR